MEKDYKYMVSVVIVTYNQEQFIRQTLESVFAQQTEYSFEVIVGEDCSSDRTNEICQEFAQKYPNMLLLSRNPNMGIVPNWVDCVNHASGKYFMQLDGDDYWNNPNKIQMQVDYMESHPDCVFCHTDKDEISYKTGRIKHKLNEINGICPPEGRIQKNILAGTAHIASNSCCYRKAIYDQHVPWKKFVELGLLGADYPTWIIMSAYGDVHYIPESTYTYRVGQESVTRQSNYEKIRHRYQIEKVQAKFFYDMFPEWGVFEDEEYYDNYVWHELLKAAYRNNDYKSARQFAQKDKFADWKTWMAFSWLSFQIARLYLNYKS